MKRQFAGVIAMALVGLVVFGCGHMPTQGWTTLIDGDKGMENWDVLGGGNWRGEAGAIQADKSTEKGASILVSKRSFKDFELYVEFWAAEDTNSGVYLRAMNPTDVRTATGAYEAQIWDKNTDPKYATGSLVNVAAVPVPLPDAYKAAGRWNVYEIRAKGPEIVLKLNGIQTVVANDGRFPEGRLGLQFNGGPIKFRKVRIREL